MLLRIAAIVSLCAPSVIAGMMLTETEVDLTSSQRVSQTIIQLDEQKVRIDRASAEEDVAFIYRADLGEFLLIDKRTRKARRMREEDLERISAQGGAAAGELEKQLKEQLKTMSKEQRAMVEQMMKARGRQKAAAPSDPVSYKKVRSGAAVGKWTADQYAGKRGGQKRWDVYTVPPAALRLSAADLAPLVQMAGFFSAMARNVGGATMDTDGLFQVGKPENGDFSGVPVRRVRYAKGQAVSQFDLTDVTELEFEEALFEKPMGFEEESITFGEQ